MIEIGAVNSVERAPLHVGVLCLIYFNKNEITVL